MAKRSHCSSPPSSRHETHDLAGDGLPPLPSSPCPLRQPRGRDVSGRRFGWRRYGSVVSPPLHQRGRDASGGRRGLEVWLLGAAELEAGKGRWLDLQWQIRHMEFNPARHIQPMTTHGMEVTARRWWRKGWRRWSKGWRRRSKQEGDRIRSLATSEAYTSGCGHFLRSQQARPRAPFCTTLAWHRTLYRHPNTNWLH